MTNHTLQQFQTIAISRKLSAAAILLWQYIYFIAAAQGRYADLCLRTADLTQNLDITRNGLQKVRRTLVNAGLLQVRIDARQRVYYTLMMNGKIVDGCDNKTNNDGKHHHGTGNPSPTMGKSVQPNITTTNDIIHNNAYRKLVDAFCAQYDGHSRNTLASVLTQFLYRRKQIGKTLTKAGLDALLHKLVTLAEGSIQTMIDIVNQSLNRGWCGFYPYKPCVATHSGRVARPEWGPPRTPKYDTKYEDLDYLEW